MPQITDEQFRLFQRYQRAYSYRIPLEIKEITLLCNKYSFPVCPRCKDSMEREYQGFCDRCGQKLAWNLYEREATNRVKKR